MKFELLGVGEAFDPELGNTSVLVHSQTKLLVDCGYAVPKNYFARNFEPDFLDAIYITHFHGDHTFGLPALLTRIHEEGRRKPLVIIGQPGVKDRIIATVDLAYSGIRSVIQYPIQFVETLNPYAIGELQLQFALSAHTIPNYSVRISDGKKVMAVSGDGAATPESIALFRDASILVHEAFKCTQEQWGHASMDQVLSFAKELPALKRLVLVHVERNERRNSALEYLRGVSRTSFQIDLPEPGAVFE